MSSAPTILTYIFCPVCDTLLLRQPTCPTCGWSRPRSNLPLGADVAPPLQLGHTVSGRPVKLGQHIWYAAPPENNDLPGRLLKIHPGTGVVRPIDLLPFTPPHSLPVALSLAADGNYLYVTLRDYALSSGRTTKTVFALDPTTGQVHHEFPTNSVELSPLTIDPTTQRGYVCGIAEDLLYTYDLTAPNTPPSWHISLTSTLTHTPLLTAKGEQIIVVSGTYFSGFTLEARETTTGTLLWQQPATSTQPIADDQYIYQTSKNSIIARHQQSGAIAWEYSDLRRTSQGVITTPLQLTEEYLLVGGGKQGGGYCLYALRTTDGTCAWQFPIPTDGSSHIMLIAPLGETVIVGDRQGHLFALALSDGSLQWQAKLSSRASAQPFVFGDILYVPTRDGYLYRLRWRVSPERPPHQGKEYGRQRDWFNGAAAHALADDPNYSAAGVFMLSAQRPDLALPLFELAEDKLNQAEALAQLGRFNEAIAIYPNLEMESLQKAEWLMGAGRYGEAGQLFMNAEAWEDAGEAFDKAERPRDALQAYERALIQYADNQTKRSAIEDRIDHLQRTTLDDEERAERLESEERWDEALALREKLGHWLRMGEICRQLSLWKAAGAAYVQQAEIETDGTEARRWWTTAGENFEKAKAWAEMVEAYQNAKQPLKVAEGLAAQDKLVAAADLLADPDEPYPATAAGYYQQAGEQKQARENPARRNAPAAELFEKAAELYAQVGRGEEADECLRRADLCLNRPRLILKAFSAEHGFQQDNVTTIKGKLVNQGAGPASEIRIEAGGPALRLADHREHIYTVEDVQTLAAGQEWEIDIPLKPKEASNESSPLEFKLWLAYTMQQVGVIRNGPFSFSVQVMPNYFRDLPQGQAQTIQIHIQQPNSYYASGDQVNTVRPGLGQTTPSHSVGSRDEANKDE